jgi:hypothetical protein
MGGPPHLPGLQPLPGKSKNHDIEFGFDMFKLSKQEAARVAKLLISDASKKIGTRAKQMERQKKLAEEELIQLEALLNPEKESDRTKLSIAPPPLTERVTIKDKFLRKKVQEESAKQPTEEEKLQQIMKREAERKKPI